MVIWGELLRVATLVASVVLAALLVALVIYRGLHARWPQAPLVFFFLKLFVGIATAGIIVFFLLFHHRAKH
jgi:hypothetical protein